MSLIHSLLSSPEVAFLFLAHVYLGHKSPRLHYTHEVTSVRGKCTKLNIDTGSCRGDFPGSSDSKESACNAGDRGSILGLGRFPWRREWQPTPVFLPGEFHGQRNRVVYSPQGRKELDTAELLVLLLLPSLDTPPNRRWVPVPC